jgi:hypothetical protein
MSTRSRIALQNEDGSITSVYCHFDGYPSNNGVLLKENYKTVESVKELLKKGDMSSLGKYCTNPEDHLYEKSSDDFTVYYGRDRGESDCGPEESISLEDFNLIDSGQEYEYLFKEKKWFYRDCFKTDKSFIEL